MFMLKILYFLSWFKYIVSYKIIFVKDFILQLFFIFMVYLWTFQVISYFWPQGNKMGIICFEQKNPYWITIQIFYEFAKHTFKDVFFHNNNGQFRVASGRLQEQVFMPDPAVEKTTQNNEYFLLCHGAWLQEVQSKHSRFCLRRWCWSRSRSSAGRCVFCESWWREMVRLDPVCIEEDKASKFFLMLKGFHLKDTFERRLENILEWLGKARQKSSNGDFTQRNNKSPHLNKTYAKVDKTVQTSRGDLRIKWTIVCWILLSTTWVHTGGVWCG